MAYKKLFILLCLILLPVSLRAQGGTNNVFGNITTNGASCATPITANCVSLRFQPNTIYSTITLSGTWTGTISFEVSGDYGVTWVAAPATTSSTSNGTTQFSIGAYSAIRARGSASMTGTAVMTIVGSTQAVTAGTGTGSAQAPSSAYTFSVTGGVVTATPNAPGLTSITGSDAAVVVQSAINAVPAGGTFFFKNGVYPINSMTLEANGGYSNYYYAIAIPANAGSANQYGQWHFIGESASFISGQAVQAQGVIFDITAAALTSCGATHFCMGWWERPDTTNHTGNDVRFENVFTRFPDNTRGNECAYCMWEASTVDYYNVIAGLNTNTGSFGSPTLPAPTAGASHMIGMTSTMSGRNNWQRFVNTWVYGYDIGYDIESEHSLLQGTSAGLCNYGYQYGRTGTYGSFTSVAIYHPGIWEKVTDQENLNGLVLGSNVGNGSLLNIDGYDIETLTSGAFTRVNNLTETNLGSPRGSSNTLP